MLANNDERHICKRSILGFSSFLFFPSLAQYRLNSVLFWNDLTWPDLVYVIFGVWRNNNWYSKTFDDNKICDLLSAVPARTFCGCCFNFSTKTRLKSWAIFSFFDYSSVIFISRAQKYIHRWWSCPEAVWIFLRTHIIFVLGQTADFDSIDSIVDDF